MSTPRSSCLLFCALGLVVGCVEDLPPVGHVVIYIDTDAPLPTAAGTARTAGAPAPLFDRVRVELFAPGATAPCDGCVREFDLDEALVRSGASLTVVAADGAGTAPRARLRMFRGTPLDADPARESTVELDLQLPEIPAEGRVVITAFLPTDAVGAPIGSLDMPREATLGWSGRGRPGTWTKTHRVPCAGPARPGEVCIPGGAYWMGNRAMVALKETSAANIERLVVLSPFWMDQAEATVREFRDAMSVDGGDTGAIPWTGEYGGGIGSVQNYCTFTAVPDPAHDSLPLNCVWPDAAAAYCARKGSRLPTEAEFEFVAGNFASQLHPWGADEPSCEDAVWGRSNMVADPPLTVSPCLPPDEVAMPLALFDGAGTPRPGRDRVELEDGTIYDLAGSMSEWTADYFNEPWEPCWNREGSQVLADPRCDTAGKHGADARTLRGGCWFGSTYLTRSPVRLPGRGPEIETGVRCVRSATTP